MLFLDNKLVSRAPGVQGGGYIVTPYKSGLFAGLELDVFSESRSINET
jgi:hypothetical protein